MKRAVLVFAETSSRFDWVAEIEELFMSQLRRTGLVLGLGMALLVCSGFTSWHYLAPVAKATSEGINRHIALLKSGKAQQRAAAAYWLGQQKAAAAEAVEPLVGLLGDTTEVNPAQYRNRSALQKLTLGEEAAAALVNIGHASVEPLIRVLTTSPAPEARKNAAWALGALHDSGATSTQI
jgi:PBS lyase HEAT-like repeat-containing protein